jgi:ubiquinone/menaquinone biosynthesis C-methylase UbiE
MISFDDVADRYDETRGGEARGDDSAAELHARLPFPDRLVLEVGVGTGVVALGLRRRGCSVVGVDLSRPMLARARDRLGSGLVQADACRLPMRQASVSQAVSVWVVHAVQQPALLFAEVARVLSAGGTYLVCPTNRPAGGDLIGEAIERMAAAVDAHIGRAARPGMEATPQQVLRWAKEAGFEGEVVPLVERHWPSSPEREIRQIRQRVWSALVGLDDITFERLTRPTIEVLAALPRGPTIRSVQAELVVLRLTDSTVKTS